ncbi:MAG: XdhC family protein [Nevskia sp.]|nr:XdhC family protein [Nevskia sp.]
MEMLQLAAQWNAAGRRVALATVVATWGSSPRPAGSQLIADESGRFAGSVSGGCIEAEVIRACSATLASGTPQLLEFGVANEQAWALGLSCGGTVQVFVEALATRAEMHG